MKIHAALRLGLDARLAVGNLDTDLLGAGDDVDALACGNGVGDLCGEGGVVHEEEVDVVDCSSLVGSRIECSCAVVPLLTTKALWPEGIRWRVFLLDP